jgi:hypothetical protein
MDGSFLQKLYHSKVLYDVIIFQAESIHQKHQIII